jgi:hypothetical protein
MFPDSLGRSSLAFRVIGIIFLNTIVRDEGF